MQTFVVLSSCSKVFWNQCLRYICLNGMKVNVYMYILCKEYSVFCIYLFAFFLQKFSCFIFESFHSFACSHLIPRYIFLKSCLKSIEQIKEGNMILKRNCIFYYNFSMPFQSLNVLPCHGVRSQKCYRPKYKNCALADNWLLKISITWKEGYLVSKAFWSYAMYIQHVWNRKKGFRYLHLYCCLFHAMKTKVVRNIEENF